jgi:hypothetical protein
VQRDISSNMHPSTNSRRKVRCRINAGKPDFPESILFGLRARTTAGLSPQKTAKSTLRKFTF